MNYPRIFSRFWIRAGATASCIVLAATACHKGETSSAGTAARAADERLKWNLRTLVDAYSQAGHTDPKWDEPARRALTEFARIRSLRQEPDLGWQEVIGTNAQAAIRAGCTDPLLAYLHARFRLVESEDRKTLANTYSRIADQLQASSYPAIRKFYASLRAAGQQKLAAGNEAHTPQEVHEYRRHALANLVEALRDRTLPLGEVEDACYDLLRAVEQNSRQYFEFYEAMAQPLMENWPHESAVWLLQGNAHIEMAWDARGSGYANTVTEDGWRTFRQQLAVAEKSLNRAWELNPHDARIPTRMITVELGQGQGRERMELWFGRAMAIDTNNLEACKAKLYYLEPKWHGSKKDMLDFGWECVKSKAWGGRVPLVLLDAHIALRKYLDSEEQAGYWLRPEVWPDIKSAFDRFFELNPEATSYYSNYAWYAWHCEQWDQLNELIPKLGPVNYATFGGKDEFDNMIRLAREHARQPQTAEGK